MGTSGRRDERLEILVTKIADLVADHQNARRHTPRNIDMIRESLRRFGANRGMVAARQADGSYRVYAGNGVLEAARAEGIEKVKLIEVSGDELPVMVVDHLTEAQLEAYALADNRTGELSEWSASAIQEAIDRGVEVDWMWDAGELDELLADLASTGNQLEPLTDPDDIPEVPEEPVTELGDLWLLGDHRVLCGDATDRASIARLLESAKVDQVDMVSTDPPYGVAIGDKNKLLDQLDHGNSRRVSENILNDKIGEDDLQALIRAAFNNAAEVCRPGAVWHVAAPAGPLYLIFGTELKRLGIWRQTIQWVKNSATFSPMGVDYHWQNEPIFHGWIPGAKHLYTGDRTQTTVWEIDRPTASPDHPTMKPVALVERSIRNHTRQNDVVLDMFLGSGTAVIASSVLQRRCLGLELDPKYVDVICRRFFEFTGVAPIRERDGYRWGND